MLSLSTSYEMEATVSKSFGPRVMVAQRTAPKSTKKGRAISPNRGPGPKSTE